MVAGQRILVVDDEPMVVKGCQRILESQVGEVQTVQTGREGLDRALAEQFDVVVTDLKMPDLDGMELVRRLRRERPQTSIIIITGYGTVSSAVTAMKLGAADYIEKPFAPERLLQALQEALPAATEPPRIPAAMVRAVLELASRDAQSGGGQPEDGSRPLTPCPPSTEAKTW